MISRFYDLSDISFYYKIKMAISKSRESFEPLTTLVTLELEVGQAKLDLVLVDSKK